MRGEHFWYKNPAPKTERGQQGTYLGYMQCIAKDARTDMIIMKDVVRNKDERMMRMSSLVDRFASDMVQ
jgi:hypothetical protein